MDFYIEENIAIGFRGEKSPSYQCLCNIAIQIIELYEGKKSPIIVLLEEDFAKALSQVIRRLAKPNTKIICLDKIVTINGDYIDIGEPIMSAIPVVIKTLIYQS
jgi:ethanolamine utilization protein EutA